MLGIPHIEENQIGRLFRSDAAGTLVGHGNVAPVDGEQYRR